MCNLSYLFSGMVGAGLTLCATSYWRIRDERKQKASLCASLRMELSTVLLECQKISESPEEYYNSQKEKSAPSLHQNYTIVYDTNAGRIGSLDKKTAAAVVLAYTHLKELVDTINSYLDTCQKYITSNERGTPYVTYYQTVQNLCKTLENLKPRAAASIEEAIRLLS